MVCQAPASVSPRPTTRAASCPRCAHLRGLLAEQRALLHELLAGFAIVRAARHYEQLQAQLAARPIYDIEVERLVLAASLRRGIAPPPELFGAPTHGELATAINTGMLAPILLAPAMRGYRRGLLAIAWTPGELSDALDLLVAVAAERIALDAAERAVAALRGPGGVEVARNELQGALDALAPEVF